MNILITGAGGSIGSATIMALAKDDRHHIIAIGRHASALIKLRTCLKNENKTVRITTRVFDLSETEEQFDAFFSFLKKNITHLDVLINNAGAFINKPFVDTTQSDWNALFGTNIFGPAKLIRACLPLLLLAKQAHIVNIGSMGGFSGSQKFSGLSAYSSSKAALANLTEVLAVELPTTIHTNCLCFGSVATRMFRMAFPDGTAAMNAEDAGSFIAHFALHNWKLFNGKIIPIASATP